MAGGLLCALMYCASLGISIRGTVRTEESGEPVRMVMIESSADGVRVWSDSLGHYQLKYTSPGSHVVRFSRLGYEPRTIEVFVHSDSVMELDITLTPRPVPLEQVAIHAERQKAALPPFARELDISAEVGALRIRSDELQAYGVLGDDDALHILTTSAGIASTPESPTSLRVRGGSGDQNRHLLDGVPIFNAYHSGGTLSALNSDVLSSITVHTGAPPARYGDGVSSVVELNTKDPSGPGVHSSGSVTLFSARQTLSGQLPWLHGSYLVSGRASTRNLTTARGLDGQTNASGSFGDMFIKGTFPLLKGQLEAFTLNSEDNLTFGAAVDTEDLFGGSPMGNDLAAGDGSEPTSDRMSGQNSPATSSQGSGVASAQNSQRNAFNWSSGTQALVWRSAADADHRIELRAWRTRFDAAGDWAASSGMLHIRSILDNRGVSGLTSMPIFSSRAVVGFALEQLRVSYGVVAADPSAPAFSSVPLLSLKSAPLLFSPYVEDRFALGKHVDVTAGLRDQNAYGRWLGLEPRISARVLASDNVAVLAGYSRVHQTVQSMRNEESIIDAIVGISLPVVADRSGVPVAWSDQVSAGVEAHLGAKTTLTADAYGRSLHGLVLVAPRTAQPFAIDQFASGSGRATGATLRLSQKGSLVSGDFAYSFAETSRSADAQTYEPSVIAAHSIELNLGLRLKKSTMIRGVMQVASGRSTSVYAGEFEMAPYNPLIGPVDIAGSPQRILGTLNDTRLPMYLRFDLGARHQWKRTMFGRAASVSVFGKIRNVFNRANALGWTSPDTQTKSPVTMLPRSLVFGLGWSF